jgi:hypothetical protein
VATKNSLKTMDVRLLVDHVRKMIASADPLSILIRGMILIDKTLEDLIETFSALPYKTIDAEFKHPTLLQKAIMACSLGAISEGELACIRSINKVRNDLAHRIPVEVTADDEETVVNVFREQTLLFSGLIYNKAAFPRTFVFLLMVLFHHLSLRCQRPEDLKIKHKRDESNVESIGAIAMTVVVIRLARSGKVVTDDEISALLKEETDAVKKRRAEMYAVEEAKKVQSRGESPA